MIPTRVQTFPPNSPEGILATDTGDNGGEAEAINITFFPFIKPFPLPLAATFADMTQGVNFEGFNGDGDFVALPGTGTDTIDYFDNTGASVFAITRANVNGTIDDWVGFMFDKTDSLLYLVGVDEGTTPNTYYLASINSSGTIVNIGNDQPATDLGDVSANWWGDALDTTGATLIYREADGAGNIFVVQTNTGSSLRELEIDIANGSIVADAAANPLVRNLLALKSPNNIYITTKVITGGPFIDMNAYPNDAILPSSMLNLDYGYTQSIRTKPTQWKGYIGMFQTSLVEGPRWFATDDFNAFGDDVARINLTVT